MQLSMDPMGRHFRRQNTNIHPFLRRWRSSSTWPLSWQRGMNGRVPLKASYRLGMSLELIAQVSRLNSFSELAMRELFVDCCSCSHPLSWIEQLPIPTRIRKSEPNEDARLTEFQQELLQLAAVLKGENTLTSYLEKMGKEMTVKQGNDYIEDALKRFFEAGLYAKSMGVDEEQIVQMRPSLTTRSSKPTTNQPWRSLLYSRQH